MATVSITALVLAASRFLFDPRPAAQRGGLFLLLVSLLTGASVSTGMRVLRARRRTAAHRHWWDLGISTLLTIASAAAAIYGLAIREPLFMIFGGIGAASGGGELAYWLRRPATPMHWWFEHMGGMLGACIAATTAFLVTAGPRFGFERSTIGLWILPAVIGAPAIAIWTGYYRRRFGASPTARHTAQGSRLNAHEMA